MVSWFNKENHPLNDLFGFPLIVIMWKRWLICGHAYLHFPIGRLMETLSSKFKSKSRFMCQVKFCIRTVGLTFPCCHSWVCHGRLERCRKRKKHVLAELLYLCPGIKPSVLTLYTAVLSGATNPFKRTIVKSFPMYVSLYASVLVWEFTCEWPLLA